MESCFALNTGDNPDIQAFVRWRDPASIAIYAHREPDEHIAGLSHAPNADIPSVLTKNLPTCNNRANFVILEVRDFACFCGSKYAPSM